MLVDWLPWNHTFGGNHNFNMVLRHAGTLVHRRRHARCPDWSSRPCAISRDISPTIYFNVPAGYAALLPYLEADEALARAFFAQLRLIFYAARRAAAGSVGAARSGVAVRATGQRVPMTSSWGTTETAPLATAAHFLLDRAGNVGVPVPGRRDQAGAERRQAGNPRARAEHHARLLEAPRSHRGSIRRRRLLQPGDAVRFADADDPEPGVVFDGRLAEDFKLTTGTWVHVGALRVGVLAACVAGVAGRDRGRRRPRIHRAAVPGSTPPAARS